MNSLGDIFWDSGFSVLQILISAPILYGAIIAFVRLSGKRCTSQMNNFDWIVTVALGSLVASGILLKDVAIADALFAVAVLLLLQFCVTFLAVRNDAVDHLVKAKPRLLVDNGTMLGDAMRHERVTEQELLSAIRDNGLGALEDVKWVILESDATFSVIPKRQQETEKTGALASVRGFDTQ